MVLDQSRLDHVLQATCALATLSVAPDEYLRRPTEPLFKVTGTGFRVRPGRILTARHVVRDWLSDVSLRGLPPDRCVAIFYRSDGDRTEVRLSPLVAWSAFHHDGVDLGIIEIKEDDYPAGHLLSAPEALCAMIGDRVYIPGYPFGSHLLYRSIGGESKQYRVGPVVQQGHISAIAPHGSHRQVDRLLLDIHTASGASGSPVIHASTGELIGLHEAGREDVTAFAVPLSKGRIDTLCDAFDSSKPKAKGAEVAFQLEIPLVPRRPLAQ